MLSKLKLHSQFEEVLVNYKPSDEAIDTLNPVKIALLMGFSGSGRNSLISELLKTEMYSFIVSDTTRSPRINNGNLEKDGVEYNFRTEEDFLADLQHGNFLEAAIIHQQQVSGISIKEIKKATKHQKIALADVQIDGIDAILKVKPNAKCIFILPPSFDTWMDRLSSRGNISNLELRRRLASALDELKHLDVNKYTVIINDDLSKTAGLLRRVLEDDVALPFEGSKAERVVLELEEGIGQFLEYN